MPERYSDVMDRVRKVIECEEINEYTGKGIYVSVLDSGVARHPDLDGRVVAFRDFTGNRKKVAGPYYDDNGHGTHV